MIRVGKIIQAKQKGVVTIEVALCFIVLVFTTFFIFEICYQIFITTLTDHALRETVRETKQQMQHPVRSSAVYQGQMTFHDKLNDVFIQPDRLWHFMIRKGEAIDNQKYDLEVVYFGSYPDFINNRPSQNVRSPLAEVTLTYQYEPMLSLSDGSSAHIVRTVMTNLSTKMRVSDDGA